MRKEKFSFKTIEKLIKVNKQMLSSSSFYQKIFCARCRFKNNYTINKRYNTNFKFVVFGRAAEKYQHGVG